MLRYKKHKKHADGLAGSGVGVMDDTDREVSSFTDRAFRSLCVAEEEPFNDVPHIPSPIRGMPLSTKYHLGIFNLSVRKTQPLAQLPTITRQRGKWAPTFQPLLNCAKDGLIVAKTHTNKLCAPQPTGYKPCSKVSSLIKSFDNIENERPEQDEVSLSKGVQRGKMNGDEISVCEKAEHSDVNNETLNSISQDDMFLNESHHSHRRTAREVFLETQAEISSRLSSSPCSSGSPLPDKTKKMVNQKESLRRTAFLHSENSAFKSWSDINKRHLRGDDSDSSISGTPPILRSGTPCSPLLQRITPGVRARETGLEVGWASPASTLSNSFDAIQMLRTVPPLPNKRTTKQNRESMHRAPKAHVDNKNQPEDMQIDLGYQSPKEQVNILTKSKSPKKLNQALNTNQEKKSVSDTSKPPPKQEVEIHEIVDSSQEAKNLETPVKDGVNLSNKPTDLIPPPGRIKTLIQQIEKESVKDVVQLHSVEKKQHLKDSNEVSMETLQNTPHIKHSESNLHSNNNVLVPPWRKINANKTDLENKVFNKNLDIKESATEQTKENMTTNEDAFDDKLSIPSFNISNLLTPVIRRKSIQEAIEEQQMAITPPPSDTNAPIDQDQREINLYRKRNEYKSRATSLLFNLKDMRKRVKSTYNPSANLRNLYENNQTADARLQDGSTYSTPLMDTSKQVSETDNVCNTDSAHEPRLTKEEEAKPDFFGNSSDNYLCLSSPQQEIKCNAFENAEIPTDDVPIHEHTHKEYIPSSHLSPNEQKLKKNVEYPILNLYPKDDTNIKMEQKLDDLTKPLWRPRGESISLQEDNIKPASKQDEPTDMVSMTTQYLSESEMQNAESHIKQSLDSTEMVNPCSAEGDVGEKEMTKSESLKDDLQYYAVSNDNIESSKEHIIPKEDIEEKVEDKEPLGSDNQGEESTNAEEITRPSSIIPFKPNLFHIKDNKIKSSPVTKSVRPLLRSLSEDCLIFHKGEDNSFTVGKGDFRTTTPSSWKNRDVKKDITKTQNIAANNGEKYSKSITTQPVLQPSDHNNTENKQIKTQIKERDIPEPREEPFFSAPEWRINKEETVELVKVNISPNKHSPPLNGPFFHPVETCVSEVTGLSPECNTLLGHHANDSIKDMVNGEHTNSPLPDIINTNYSPVDNGLLQFEDAISDIACSTITSPMSESITCSVVASPMSVNTQSSGFTTALSALDDMSSPPLPCVSSRNEKSNLSINDVLSRVSTPSNHLETKSSECVRQIQEKPPCVEPLNNAHAAKPPTVPPKTEKALRRAKRLTKKRRKTEIPPKIQEGDFQESDFVLDVPSPANINPSLSTPQSNFKAGFCTSKTLHQDDSISQASTPSLPTSQRKLLQDPESGQYFVVDIPVHFRIKTFFDPETGKYLQMSLPPSERSTPTLEMSNSPFMLYQGLTPVPVSSISSLKRVSQMLNHSDLYSGEKSGSWHEGEDDCLKMQQSIDCDSCDQSMAGTPHSMDRNTARVRSPDIISMRDIDDFAMEAIS